METEQQQEQEQAAEQEQQQHVEVEDESRIFWLQHESTDLELLSEKFCPLPTIEQIKSTIAPFQQLAQQDTEYLISSCPELIESRDLVRKNKELLTPLTSHEYYSIRDKLFPLARSGPVSATVGNRAAYKLIEAMEISGIMKKLYGASPKTISQKLTALAAASASSNNNNNNFNNSNNKYKKKKMMNKNKNKKENNKTDNNENDIIKKPGRRPHHKKLREIVFVDVCGGPGSFAQACLDYIIRPIPKTKVRGFGMTLGGVAADSVSDSLVWYEELLKRQDFIPTFGIDGTGSVYLPENVEALVSLCRFNEKINFVMGDGGFEVEQDKLTMQESITARLVFSQWYIALRLLSEGGCLVLKLFETSSVFLRSMLFLSCLFFKNVSLTKPAHSRVVNSERYLSCSGFRSSCFTSEWLEYLQKVHSECFEREGYAPFTLLPNIELVFCGDSKNNNINQQEQQQNVQEEGVKEDESSSSSCSSNSKQNISKKIISKLEESIIVIAKRQSFALQMILDAHFEATKSLRALMTYTTTTATAIASTRKKEKTEKKEQEDEEENNKDAA